MPTPQVTQIVTITVGTFDGAIGLTVLDPTPQGEYAVASITVDEYGRVTQATDNPDVAAETTQTQILATVNAILLTLGAGIVEGGQWKNLP